MRILNPSSVGYIHPAISNNSNINSTLLHHHNNSSSTLITTSQQGNHIISSRDYIDSSEISENYSADLENLNGNGNDLIENNHHRQQQQQQQHQNYRFSQIQNHNQNQNQNAQNIINDFIDSTDTDNVNLTITSNRNNLSAKFIRNNQNNQIHDNNKINSNINGNTENETINVISTSTTTDRKFSNNLNEINNQVTINLNDNGNCDGNVEIFNENLRNSNFDKNININNLGKESVPVIQQHKIYESEEFNKIYSLKTNSNSVHTSEEEGEEEEEEEEEEVEEVEKDNNDFRGEETKNIKNTNLICNNYQHSAEHLNINTIVNKISNNTSTTNSNTNYTNTNLKVIEVESNCCNRPVQIEIEIGGGDKISKSNQNELVTTTSTASTLPLKENLSINELKENLDKLDCKGNLQISSTKANYNYRDCQQFDEKKSNQQFNCDAERKYMKQGDICNSSSCCSSNILGRNYQPRNGDRNLSSYSSTCSSESSPDDSLMDDEDQFSTSPQSSCTSLNSPSSELSNYPRGIINPNYPGFQHLAHTLSEHFVNQQSSDADDSDLSEFEVELSVDSIDENFSNFHNFDSSTVNSNNNVNNNLNNNNNNESTIIKNNNNENETKLQLQAIEKSKFSNDTTATTTKEINFNSQEQVAENSSMNMNEIQTMEIPETKISEGIENELFLNEKENLKKEDEKEKDENLEEGKDTKEIIDMKEFVGSLRNDNQTISSRKCNIELNSIDTLTEYDGNTIRICDSENISCDLDTYLKKYETVTDVKVKEMQEKLETNMGNNGKLNTKIADDKKYMNEGDNFVDDDGDNGRNCPTPDILIKNDKIRLRRHKPSENRPDLLRNVSPKPDSHCYNVIDQIPIIIDNENTSINNRKNENNFANEQKKCRIAVPDNIPGIIQNQRSEKDDISSTYSITPVDIVGDFGQEVEREFGLLVTGYNTTLLCQDCSPIMNPGHERKLTMQKMADAALSDAQEKLSLSHANCNIFKTSCSQTIKNSARDLIHKSSSLASSSKLLSSGDEEQLKQKQQIQYNNQQKIDQESPKVNQHPLENIQSSVPVQSLMFTSKNININHNQSGSTSTSSTIGMEKQIPTAIVKPKYQKSSYDDRQLPPIGIGYSIESDLKNAWYSNNMNGSDRSRKIQSQSSGLVSTSTQQFDRNSKHMKKSASRVSNVSQSREKLTNSRPGGDIVRDNNEHDNVTNSNSNNSNSSSVIAIVTPRKKDKMEIGNNCEKLFDEKNLEKNNNHNFTVIGGNNNNNNNISDNKRNDTLNSIKKDIKKDHTTTASFDVYNIETALPVIDLEAIENHLKKAKEEERKRRNDREEIRRRLAMGAEDDYFSKMVTADRPGRKPSLQSRLQSGMNLQICFMNEASSDTESPSSDSETCPKLSKSITNSNKSNNLSSRYSSSSLNSAHPYNSRPLSVSISNNNNNNKKSFLSLSSSPSSTISSISSISSQNRPSSLSLGPPIPEDNDESDFFTKQARLQIEARMALAQAKDMAHMQMEIERQKQKQSPITEVIRNSLEKVGVPFPPEKRRVSRQMLTDMNIAQLQIIVNELHTQIERLNERLVQYLMERDDLHMSQDSMLVDIEDLTRYLGAKEQSRVDEKANQNKSTTTTNTNNAYTLLSSSSSIKSDKQKHQHQQQHQKSNIISSASQTQSKFQRIANLVKK